MELMDTSMDKLSERVSNVLQSSIPEKILGKMSVAVSDPPPNSLSVCLVCCELEGVVSTAPTGY